MKLFQVANLEELAELLQCRAVEIRKRAARQIGTVAQKVTREDLMMANVWESAANIVRDSEIVPETERLNA